MTEETADAWEKIKILAAKDKKKKARGGWFIHPEIVQFMLDNRDRIALIYDRQLTMYIRYKVRAKLKRLHSKLWKQPYQFLRIR